MFSESKHLGVADTEAFENIILYIFTVIFFYANHRFLLDSWMTVC